MLVPFRDKMPQLDSEVFIADTARVIGDVKLGARCSVMWGAVLRADFNSIHVGEGSNIQDGAIVHVYEGELATRIGQHVTIGHGAIVHGCTIGDRCLIGIGAKVLNGAVVGEDCIIAAGALVPEGKEIPPGSLVMGVPGKVVRSLTAEDRERSVAGAEHYVELGRQYRSQ